jgi:predicted CoA-substrate-specific enzyme activase
MKNFLFGIDIGSTTVKLALLNSDTKEVLYNDYQRHNTQYKITLIAMLKKMHKIHKDISFFVAVTGSCSSLVNDYLKTMFIQEVAANTLAVQQFFPNAKVAIELGGQDAKIIFFNQTETSSRLSASDMRMNGICAGGTGAFIDQIAQLLNVPVEEFNSLAEQGKNLYDISGRCGVFAKTDIQPLLAQGVSKADIALSAFHAIAKQTIGGLAQGTEIHPPIVFQGGPLTFNPKLIKVFQEKLNLDNNQLLIHPTPEIMVAIGAGISLEKLFKDNQKKSFTINDIIQLLEQTHTPNQQNITNLSLKPFFSSKEKKELFHKKHTIQNKKIIIKNKKTTTVNAYIGIDAGSTTCKAVLMDENTDILETFYLSNKGNSLDIIKQAIKYFYEFAKAKNINLNILGTGTTGYGELLMAKAIKADFHAVETICHAKAALKYFPDATFILDIGGQDMKAIRIKEEIITGITLNEACSAGCGSFIETYAKSLNVPIEEIATKAFQSNSPSRIGSRCTVFMNSCIISEQKNNKSTEDILAGICYSIIENVFTKVIRVSNMESLGSTIVAQGGTFKNDAVLRALELYSEKNIVRAPYPGEMGAIGVALLTKEYVEEKKKSNNSYESSFIGISNLEKLQYSTRSGVVCTLCNNNCKRTVVSFSDNSYYITGNRCEKGQFLLENSNSKKAIYNIDKSSSKTNENISYNLIETREKELLKQYEVERINAAQKEKIGIPLCLDFFYTLPFWKTLWQALGFDVILSNKSSQALFEKGASNIPSDTVCFPAKLVHGHINNLIEKKVDRIFMPMMVEHIPPDINNPKEKYTCPVYQGYPLIIQENDKPFEKYGVTFDCPSFRWPDIKRRNQQIVNYFKETFSIPKKTILKAIEQADNANNSFQSTMLKHGEALLNHLKQTKKFGVVVIGRPYHYDKMINHNIANFFTKDDIAVFTFDSLPINEINTEETRPSFFIINNANNMKTTLFVAKNPQLELVQIVSFGCGHEAINTDEMERLLIGSSNKQMLSIKLDESDVSGPLHIRIKSFIATVAERRKKELKQILSPYKIIIKSLEDPFFIKFEKKDKDKRVILIPNLSIAFSELVKSIAYIKGYNVDVLPLADNRAKELGKKYVNNDICYPAQINIGEALAYLEKNPNISQNEITLGFANSCDACRAGSYVALARKALDEAGYPNVSLLTNGEDHKNIHPGFNLGFWFQKRMIVGLGIIDFLEEMRFRTRPYEIVKGETNKVFQYSLERITTAIKENSKLLFTIFNDIVNDFNHIKVNRKEPKPRVFIIGEILMNYHDSANEFLIDYLEEHGLEVKLPYYTVSFARDFVNVPNALQRKMLANPLSTFFINKLSEKVYFSLLAPLEKIKRKFRYYEERPNIKELGKVAEKTMDLAYNAGEGWLMPAEIIASSKKAVNSFVIVQPFGCLPNHIVGRGMIKKLKNECPNIQILSLDYDYDTSKANLENRLQLLIIHAKENHYSLKQN